MSSAHTHCLVQPRQDSVGGMLQIRQLAFETIGLHLRPMQITAMARAVEAVKVIGLGQQGRVGPQGGDARGCLLSTATPNFLQPATCHQTDLRGARRGTWGGHKGPGRCIPGPWVP